MILDTNMLDNYMESVIPAADDGIPPLTARDFSECSSVMEASMQAQQEQADAWQAFNQRIARVEATYLRENGVAMVYTEANIKELISGGVALLQRGWANFMGVLQKGMDTVKSWIGGNAKFVNANKAQLNSGCGFPANKKFEGYDYKNALSKANTTDTPADLVSTAETDGFDSKYASFVNSIGGSDGKLNIAKFKAYLIGDKKITIDGSYLSSKSCIEQMQRASDLVTVFKNAKQKAEKDYKASISALKQAQKGENAEQSIHKHIANYNKLITLNTNMLTAKLQVCSNYITQIDKIARIYVSADSKMAGANKKGASNDPKLLGDGSSKAAGGEAQTESTVFGFESIFA